MPRSTEAEAAEEAAEEAVRRLWRRLRRRQRREAAPPHPVPPRGLLLCSMLLTWRALISGRPSHSQAVAASVQLF